MWRRQRIGALSDGAQASGGSAGSGAARLLAFLDAVASVPQVLEVLLLGVGIQTSDGLLSGSGRSLGSSLLLE